MVASPAVGCNSVVSMRNVVDLPAPFGPRNPTSSPSATSMSTPATASTGPVFVVNRRARPRALIMTESPLVNFD